MMDAIAYFVGAGGTLLFHPWFEFVLAALWIGIGTYQVRTGRRTPLRTTSRDGAQARKWGMARIGFGVAWAAAGIAWMMFR